MPLLLEVDDRRLGRLVVGQGQRVALLGMSGSGKTRLLRAVVGLAAEVDLIRIEGHPQSRKGRGSVIGWVPEQGAVFSDLSVLDNVARPPHLTPTPEAEALDALDLVALAGRAGEPAGALSNGERRRVALARAIARRASLLVIDGDLDATLAPLLPAVLDVLPHVLGVLTSGCTADDWAWRADSVALVHDARVVCQAPLGQLVDSLDPAVRSVMSWVMPRAD